MGGGAPGTGGDGIGGAPGSDGIGGGGMPANKYWVESGHERDAIVCETMGLTYLEAHLALAQQVSALPALA